MPPLLLRRLVATLLLTAGCGIGTCGAAAAAEGSLKIENAGSVALERRTILGQWRLRPEGRIEAGAGTTGRTRFPDGGVAVHAVSYRDPGSYRQCSFRVQTEPGPASCTIAVAVVPRGGALCDYRFLSSDTRTCSYALSLTISGF